MAAKKALSLGVMMAGAMVTVWVGSWGNVVVAMMVVQKEFPTGSWMEYQQADSLVASMELNWVERTAVESGIEMVK
jgi:hypothetical protein